MKYLFTLFLVTSVISAISQENTFYRICLNDDTIIEASKIQELENRTNYISINGTANFIENHKINRIKTVRRDLEEFIFADKKFSDFTIVKIDSLSKNELYFRTLNWIKESYKNPDEVIKMSIENEKIRINGFKDNFICIKALGLNTCYYGVYTIEISFKDGRYKFDPSYLEYRIPPSQYSVGTNVTFHLDDMSSLYNEKGNIRNMYKQIPAILEDTFNELNYSLLNYIVKYKTSNDNW